MSSFQLIKKLSATFVLATLLIIAAAAAVHHTRAGQGTNQTPFTQQGRGKLRVVASYYPLYDFAQQIGGDLVQVTNMTPAGAEPHDYEPSARALAVAQAAPLFLYNGAHFEPWVNGFLQDYHHRAVKTSSGLSLRTTTAQQDASAKITDPHYWLDPILAMRVVDAISEGMSQADPAHASTYAAHASAYKQALQRLNQRFVQGLASCQQHTIITSHQAFGYVGARYHVTMAPIAGLDPESEPSPATVVRLVQLMQEQGLRYVTFESLVSPRLADALGAETGAQALVLDPIEGLSAEDQARGHNYLTLQEQNLKNMRQALACK